MSRRVAAIGVLMVLSVLPASADEKSVPKETSSSPKPILISDVIIQGNQRTSTEQVKARLRTQVGKEYDSATLDEDVRELYKTRQFSNIQTFLEPDGPGKVKLYFSVRDQLNKVQKVAFLGAKHIKEENLRKATGVHVSMPLNPKLNQEGCRKILDKYEEMGRPFASCILVKGGAPSDTEVVYQITEGPKVRVRDIRFIGHTFVSGARLATQIKSSPTWFHAIGGVYNSRMAEEDVEELTKYFKSFGYRDAHVSLETQRSADSGEVTLIFHIHEGPRYTVKDIPQVLNAQSIPHEQLEAMLLTKSGEHLDENKIQADEERIRNYYGYTGRDVQVRHNYIWSQDTPVVCQVQYQIEEHPQKTLVSHSQIFIISNTRTRDNVILRHVPLFPSGILSFPDVQQAENNPASSPTRVGQVFLTGNERISIESILAHVPLFPGKILSYPELQQVEKNLAELGLFVVDPVSGVHPTITVLNPDSDSVFKDILIKVTEKKASDEPK